MSTFTTSKQLELVARGDDVGVWDTPENSNWSVVDAALGGQVAIPVAGANITLSPAQYQQNLITLTGALLASITVTFPTSFTGPYTIYNNTTGSSAFTVTLTTTGGGAFIGVPPGDVTETFNIGTGFIFRSLPHHIGEYWDDAGSSVPGWVGACSTPPYLACNGTTFSSATYPVLTVKMGTTTLPDSPGRARIALDAGTNRVSSAVSGIAGNTRFASGGDQLTQFHNHNLTLTDLGHAHTVGSSIAPGSAGGGSFGVQTGVAGNAAAAGAVATTGNSTTGITIVSSGYGSGASQNMPPVYVGGITMIRAA